MYAQIGDIVLQGNYGFTSFASADGSNIVEHALIEGKPKLQKVGENLTKLTWTININAGFVDAETEIAKWKQYVSDATPVPITLGTGEFLGFYVLTSANVSLEQTDNNGGIIQASLDVAASEFVVDSEENKGKAVLSNNPATLTSVPVNKSTAGQITADVRECSNISAEMDQNLIIAESNPTKRAAKFSDTAKKIQQVDNKLAGVYIATANAFRLINEAQNLRQVITTTRTKLATLKSFCQIHDVDGAKAANRDFQSNMRNVSVLTAPFTKTYTLRKSA